MEKIETKKLIAAPNGIGDYTKEYSSYRTLCADLGIDLLCSDFAENNPYMIINRRTDNQNWEENTGNGIMNSWEKVLEKWAANR